MSHTWQRDFAGPIVANGLPMPADEMETQYDIYVADDDEAMRHVVAATLAEAGYAVWQACDGRELLDRLLHDALCGATPALVVSDVSMPRLSGPDACASARAAGIDTPFIFMTAFASVGGRNAAEAVAAIAVFDKPFDVDELVVAIGDQLEHERR